MSESAAWNNGPVHKDGHTYHTRNSWRWKDESMVLIEFLLSQDYVTWFNATHERLTAACPHRWCVKVQSDTLQYAQTKIHGTNMYMHTLFANPEKDEDYVVDHYSRNGLDNTDQNIHKVPQWVNMLNCKLSNRNTSGVPNVSVNWEKRTVSYAIRKQGMVVAKGSQRWKEGSNHKKRWSFEAAWKAMTYDAKCWKQFYENYNGVDPPTAESWSY
jgi:hypothetical protein